MIPNCNYVLIIPFSAILPMYSPCFLETHPYITILSYVGFVQVNGGNQAPLYTKLKSYDGIGTSSNIAKISWNFEKFIIDGNGVPIRRYKPGVEPSQITGDIDELIKTGKLPPKKKPTLNDF